MEQFLPVERLSSPIPLGDRGERILQPLVGREPTFAQVTFATSPNDLTTARYAGVDDAAIDGFARWALHRLTARWASRSAQRDPLLATRDCC
jgi:hypothetical protein